MGVEAYYVLILPMAIYCILINWVSIFVFFFIWHIIVLITLHFFFSFPFWKYASGGSHLSENESHFPVKCSEFIFMHVLYVFFLIWILIWLVGFSRGNLVSMGLIPKDNFLCVCFFQVTYSIPFALASIFSSSSGAGQGKFSCTFLVFPQSSFQTNWLSFTLNTGLSLGVLNLGIVMPQVTLHSY